MPARHAALPARRTGLMVAGATVAGSALVLSAGVITAHLSGQPPTTTAAMAQPAPLHSLLAEVDPGHTSANGAGPLPSQAPASPSPHPSASPARPRPAKTVQAAAQQAAAPYANPFRDVSGLLPERIDEGVDFGGSGPVYALGDAVITGATSSNYGWPGGGWITYQLTSGPDAGLMVFLAEDVTPTVQVGQHVTASTVIANMYDGGDGIETGWAQPDGSTAESQLPEAGGIGGGGPFPTMIGLNFEELLQTLGVPAANNRDATAYGQLPASYPASR